jgi:TRAP-type mannitol/chloroaromatic compound transport system permease large subunit
MRQKNQRVVTVGSVLFLAAIAFFLFMLSVASKSTDPVELMRTVGMVSGVVGGLAIAMIVVGLFGKKSASSQANLATTQGK